MKALLIAIFLLASYYYCNAQLPPPVQSPDVTNINRFINFPVNKSTGVPQINVPIYTIKCNDFSFPISLAYHAGGIRVEEMASNVGLGWALIADGVITRTIKGYPDEIGWYSNYGPIPYVYPVADYDETGNLSGYRDQMHEYDDSQPDIFQFSVNGLSGRFLFDKNRKIHLLPEQDIKVEELNSSLTSWKITSPDGTQYILGAPNDYAQSLAGNGNTWPTAYHLSSIVTPDHRHIDFQYASDDILQTVPTHGSGPAGGGIQPPIFLAPHAQVVHSNKITKIISDICTVEFHYQSHTREDYADNIVNGENVGALEVINIIDNFTNSSLKKFTFTTSYFTSNTTTWYPADNYLKKRLRLDEMKECDAAGNCLPPFRFSYNKFNKTLFDYLPNRLSLGQDAWGYYNGWDDNKSLYPLLQESGLTVIPGGNREGNENYIKAYILDEITYPTGAVTSYRYEPIKYSSASSLVVGGLRVKQIWTSAGIQEEPTVKTFEYDGVSIVGGSPTYISHILSDDLLWGDDAPPACNPNSNIPIPTTMYNTDPFVLSSGLLSQYIFHSKVVERNSTEGSIESYFDDHELRDETIDLTNATYPAFPTAPLLSSGKLIEEVYKDKNERTVRDIVYNYSKSGYLAIDNAYIVFKPFCWPRKRGYQLLNGYSYLIGKVENDFDNNGGNLTITTTYDYGQRPTSPVTQPALHHFPTKVAVNSSDGSTRVRYLKYALDYKADLGTVGETSVMDDASAGVQESISEYNVANPTETLETRVVNGTELITGATLLQYRKAVDGDNNPVFSLVKTSDLPLQKPLQLSTNFMSRISHSGNTYHFDFSDKYQVQNIILKCNENKNILEAMGRDGLTKSFIWGYNNEYLVAAINNAPYKNVFYTSFEELSGSDVSLVARVGRKSKLNGFIKELSGLDNGQYTLSFWSYKNGSWTYVEINPYITNGSYTINLDGQLDDLRFYPFQAEMLTYTYLPNIGVSSISDIKGRASVFEYDNFQRLHLAKDKDNNILKKYTYQYNSLPVSGPDWESTGSWKYEPCQVNPLYNTNKREVEYKDLNPGSLTYNISTWLKEGVCSSCDVGAYENTSTATRCSTDAYNVNTGFLEREVKDVNPCSPLFGTTHWVFDSYSSSCPIPTVYARIEYGNVSYFDSEADADIEVHFYSDVACTHPFNANYNVIVTAHNSCTGANFDYSGGGGAGYVTVISQAPLYYPDDQNQNCTFTFNLHPSSQFTAVN